MTHPGYLVISQKLEMFETFPLDNTIFPSIEFSPFPHQKAFIVSLPSRARMAIVHTMKNATENRPCLYYQVLGPRAYTAVLYLQPPLLSYNQRRHFSHKV